MHNLGSMYKAGDGVPQDFVKAATWFQKAAEQGVDAAQFSLGLMYENGEGVPQDLVKAAAWFQKAADQGFSSAQNHLTKCLNALSDN